MKLNKDFYMADSPELAQSLLGKLLCVKSDGIVKKFRITETEAYFGTEDTACHAHKGRTKRTETLYSEGGVLYVYLCYGIHSLINIVCGESDFPQAVLIRGVEGASGPGRVSKKLGIDLSFNNLDIIQSDILWVEDDGYIPSEIKTSPRIGINYATEYYRNIHWRFYIEL